MYPDRELIRLAAQKTALLRTIACRRAECIEAAARVAQPLEWMDQMLAFWRRLSPFARFAAVPLGFLAQRTIFSRRKILGSLVRWRELVFGTLRGLRSVFNPPAS